MRFGVVVFPGTWSDCDFHYVISEVLHQPVKYVWHRERDLADLDCVILPGGFSYGDYLRAGAVAGRSPVVEALREFVARRRPRARLLQRLPDPVRGRPAAGRAHAQRVPAVPLPVDAPASSRTSRRRSRAGCGAGQVLTMPISHGEGKYHADAATLGALEAATQIVFRYCDRRTAGSRTDANPNGSLDNIAGIVNEDGNVLG